MEENVTASNQSERSGVDSGRVNQCPLAAVFIPQLEMGRPFGAFMLIIPFIRVPFISARLALLTEACLLV